MQGDFIDCLIRLSRYHGYMTLKYRPEIDGLRALAVLAVIFYHAGFLTGGFIGVDIFFVISGYLITSIILREMDENRFSLAKFYERRARRILPALLLVILVSLPIAWMLILPKGLNEYAYASLSALGFGSNFWFWWEDSYTAEPSKLKPLLHTWTLAVEEQFYILFPILLMLITRKYLLSLFVLGALISLQTAESLSAQYPDATFYLLHTRAWELLAGAILAKMEIKRSRTAHTILNHIMPALGIALIAYALFAFEDTMRHPAYITALPIIGTMLFIWFAQKGEPITNILSSKAFVAIGLISYSLYLWHWPIFAFARIEMGDLEATTKLTCIVLSFILAGASYRLIERPMRYHMPLKPFIAVIAAAMIILIVANIYILKTDGAKHRLAGYDALFELGDAKNSIDGQKCFQPRPRLGQHCKFPYTGATRTVIGIGDSHLAMHGQALKDFAHRNGMTYEQFPRCVFIPGTEIHKTDNTVEANPCPEKQMEELAKYKNALVVKTSRLTWRITGTTQSGGVADQYAPVEGNIKDAIRKTNEAILAQGHTLVQIYPVPEIKISPAYSLKKLLKGHEFDYKDRLQDLESDPELTSSLAEYVQRHKLTFEALDSVQGEDYIRLYPHEVLCDETAKTCKTLMNGHILYKDMNHLTRYGTGLVVEEIQQKVIK